MEEKQYSGLSESFDLMKKQAERRAALSPVTPFAPADMTPEATKERVLKALSDYEYFDTVYFPPELYQDYAPSGSYHRAMSEEMDTPGVTIHAGPRDFGKSVHAKKRHTWYLLKGVCKILAIGSSTIPLAENLMRSIARMMFDNERIMHDFVVEFIESNAEQIRFRTGSQNLPYNGERCLACFSEGRSLRGFAQGFSRPDRGLIDDLETLKSPMDSDNVEARINYIEEFYGSLGGEAPTLYCMGNNFHVAGYINTLFKQQTSGILGGRDWRVTIWPAFSNGVSLWPEKYPATSNEEMMVMVGARTITSYNSNWNQKPTPAEGHVFKREFLTYWDSYPSDARGVVYTDPNLALRSKGDTAGLTRMTYSPSTQNLYITGLAQTFDDPNKMLDAVFELYNSRVVLAGLEGKVNQESHWYHHIIAWQAKRGKMFPPIKFCRFDVDALATNLQIKYTQGKVLFDPSMQYSEQGSKYIEQFVAFTSKKANGVDDAPDSAICALALLMLCNLNTADTGNLYSITTFSEDD